MKRPLPLQRVDVGVAEDLALRPTWRDSARPGPFGTDLESRGANDDPLDRPLLRVGLSFWARRQREDQLGDLSNLKAHGVASARAKHGNKSHSFGTCA